MRLLTFLDNETGAPKLGALLATAPNYVLDIAAATRLAPATKLTTGIQNALAVGDMALLLANGEAGHDAVKNLIQHAEQELGKNPATKTLEQADWLRQEADLHYLPVVHRPGKIVCVGLNFQSHIDEALAAGQKLPQSVEVPGAFTKVSSALLGHRNPIVFPKQGEQLDYEVELALIIGKQCKNIKAEDYQQYLAGVSIGVDLSLRDILFRSPNPFEAKNYDGFCPLGPHLVSLNEAGDPDQLLLQLWVNNELRQEESMANALFSCGEVLAYWSERMTFEPGDVVLMGTPAGVGIFAEEPSQRLLKPGDQVKAAIGQLAELQNDIVATTNGN
ncbi:MAG TPA: fumarylacetoacetate hydrolase family protein [Burkholderiaceae bacterium]|nr:fumarylacetoacetate hydrolase family protein [Burkholderiaceae bacterium]